MSIFLYGTYGSPIRLRASRGIARERGYFVESDRVTGTTKILDVSGLEVEFLIGKRGAGVDLRLEQISG